MKIGTKIFALFFCLLLVGFTVQTAEASPLNDSTLVILKTSTAPVVDTELDAVWVNAAAIPMLKPDPDATELDDDNWYDCYPTVRVLWDEDMLYLYYEVHDDELRADADAVHEDDSFELFFDGGNDKTDGDYDGVNDFQFRFSYEDETNADLDAGTGNAGEPAFDVTTIEYAKRDTVYPDDMPGFVVEAAIPWSELQFDPTSDGSDIGFDVQYNDNDTGARDHMLRWWTMSNDAWFDASQFGNAILSPYTVSSNLAIAKVNGTAPAIDGTMDAPWSASPMYSGEVFVIRQAGAIDDGLWTDLEFWGDIQFDFKVLYDDEFFYFYADVLDDELDTSSGADAPHENDGVEVYFDTGDVNGDNTSESFAQYRYVWDTELGDAMNTEISSADVFAFVETETGYTFELKAPLDSLPLGEDYEDNFVFGFEVQVNDMDDAERHNLLRWWSDDNNSWQDAGLFGTAVLNPDLLTVGVNEERTPVISTFALEQNYPNPFNPETHIGYTVPADGHVTLTVYNVLGEEVATLVNGYQTANHYTVQFDGSSLSSGIYFYTLQTASNVWTKKMMLLK